MLHWRDMLGFLPKDGSVWSTTILSILIVSILSIVLIIRSRMSTYVQMIEAISGPKSKFPILGHAWEFLVPYEHIFMKMVEIIDSYPKSVGRIWIANEAYVFVKDAEALESVMNSSVHITKSADYRYLHNWLGLGLLTSTGQRWHFRRKLLTPSFHFNILEQFVSVFNEHSDILIAKLQEHVGKGSFDIFPYFTMCALDMICETSMGKSVNAQGNKDSEYVQAVSDMGKVLFIRVTRPWLRHDWLYNLTSLGRLEKRSLKVLHSFTEQVIKERQQLLANNYEEILKNNEEKGVVGQKRRLAFLDMLLHASSTDEKFTMAHVREEVDTIMFEGHDTTASGLSWTFYLLGCHPDIQEKAQEELDDIFGETDRALTMADVNKMKYLEAVIKETMRLYPPVPVVARYLKEDAIIGGHKVPAHTNILLHIFLAHRDESVFPDPEKFDPTRFFQERDNKRNPYAYVPFSAGLRNCIGQKFAMIDMKIVLAKVLRKFTVTSLVKRSEMKYFSQPVLQPIGGIQVTLEPRDLKYTS